MFDQSGLLLTIRMIIRDYLNRSLLVQWRKPIIGISIIAFSRSSAVNRELVDCYRSYGSECYVLRKMMD